VKISDEEAARILTVGQAVDFVLASRVAADGTPPDSSLASRSQTAASQAADAE